MEVGEGCCGAISWWWPGLVRAVDVETWALLMIRGRSPPSTELSARRWLLLAGRSVSRPWYWMRRAHSETGGGAMTIDADAAETACACCK